MKSELFLTSPYQYTGKDLYKWLFSVYLRLTKGIQANVKPSGTQSINDITETLITFNTINADTISAWDTATNLYNVKDGGNYNIMAGIELNAALTTSLSAEIRIKVNGTTVHSAALSADMTNPGLFINRIIPVSTNDQIGIYCYHNIGSAKSTIVSNNRTFLHIYRVN